MNKRIHNWSEDGPLRRVIRNAGFALAGDLSASLLRLLTVALTARALQIEEFGILILVQAYIAVVDRLVNFQSWQAVIKFGAEKSHSQVSSLNDLYKFGLLVDIATALFGCFLAALIPSVLGRWLSWDVSTIWWASAFALVIAFNLEGFCIAALRLNDRFDLLAWNKLAAAIIKFVPTLFAFFLTESLAVFFIIAIVSQIVAYILLLATSFYVLHYKKIMPLSSGSIRRAIGDNRGIYKYLITTNLHASVRMIPDHVDYLFISSVLGVAETGLYKIAKEISRVLAKAIQPLYQSIYPELARLAADNMMFEFRRLALRSASLALLASLAFIVLFYSIGEFAIAIIFGPNFVSTYTVVIILTIGTAISAATFPVTPAVLALGYPMLPLIAVTLAVCVYLLSLQPLIANYGIAGAGWASVAFFVSWLVIVCISYVLIRTIGHGKR